jgi:hypothetical protein
MVQGAARAAFPPFTPPKAQSRNALAKDNDTRQEGSDTLIKTSCEWLATTRQIGVDAQLPRVRSARVV